MAENKRDIDLEWPTFDQSENDYHRGSYSPDPDREKIFTEFKLATEDHGIRNKKRKPKKNKKTRTSIRLISESDTYGSQGSCDRKRCIVISVLVASLLIIIGICVFLGIYFGVMTKQTDDPSAVVEVVINSTTSARTTTVLTTTHRTTQKPLPPTTRSPTTTTTKKPTTTSTTTITTSTTTTSTTTATTTTTTTPAPTEPPVIRFSGAEGEISQIVNVSKDCVDMTILVTDGLSQNQKCELYYEMMRCVYVSLVEGRLYVDVDSLGQVVETNKGKIFPSWIVIVPETCRNENNSLDIRNISTLPVTLNDLCTSPDVIVHHGKHTCGIIDPVLIDKFYQHSEDNKCSVYWGILGCLATVLDCEYPDIDNTVYKYGAQFLSELHLSSINQTYCQEKFSTITEQSECSSILHQNMLSILTRCSPVIQQGSPYLDNPVTSVKCMLFEAFFECSFNLISSELRYEKCQLEKNILRHVTFDIARTAASVTLMRPFFNVTQCIDTPSHLAYICESPSKLLSAVDTFCYQTFRFVIPETVCKYVSEYIYSCGPRYLEKLGITECTSAQITRAMTSQADQFKNAYGIDITKFSAKDDCIEPPT